jgi:putative peptide zinc metalloprotease protein
MNTTNIKYQLCNFEKEGRYIVISNNDYYTVDKISFQILDCLKQNLSFKTIAELINNTHKTDYYNAKKVEEICYEKTIREIISNEDVVDDNKNRGVNKAIYCRVNLIKPEKAANLFQSVVFLFSKKLYNPLLILSIFWSMSYILYGYFFNISKPVIYNPFVRAEVFLFLFAIFFLHEIGHAAAAKKHGINAKGIGFGFYIIFPVLYTDITEVWLLDKKKRIQINIAGIYFQLLLNMILITLHFIYLKNELFTTLIACNIFSILLSFNPFFKYDGYWVASDFLNIPNLSKKANECLKLMRKFITQPKLMLPLLKLQPLSLKIYSGLSFIFWTCFFIKLFLGLFFKTKTLLNKTSVQEWTFYNYANALGLLITFILLSYILSQKIKNNYNEQSNLS